MAGVLVRPSYGAPYSPIWSASPRRESTIRSACRLSRCLKSSVATTPPGLPEGDEWK